MKCGDDKKYDAKEKHNKRLIFKWYLCSNGEAIFCYLWMCLGMNLDQREMPATLCLINYGADSIAMCWLA